ncbi:hypothetical protein B0H16DRAFT_1452230 [Mycena metata]|uniref:Uncharacterized protein n=1 Tax=Mycena metata TaxID=1033252 RepID=A0AAD7NP26_9AGAR|nr:hypothetical protein B0H16DRAFT_1452230 [Mycena metata]
MTVDMHGGRDWEAGSGRILTRLDGVDGHCDGNYTAWAAAVRRSSSRTVVSSRRGCDEGAAVARGSWGLNCQCEDPIWECGVEERLAFVPDKSTEHAKGLDKKNVNGGPNTSTTTARTLRIRGTGPNSCKSATTLGSTLVCAVGGPATCDGIGPAGVADDPAVLPVFADLLSDRRTVFLALDPEVEASGRRTPRAIDDSVNRIK